MRRGSAIAGGVLALITLLLCCPGAGAAPAWRFMAIADSRGAAYTEPVNSNIVSELARQAVLQKVALILFGGDLVYWGNSTAFDEWTNCMAPAYAAGIPVYPVLGNHDEPDIPSFLRVFGPALPDNGPPDEIDRTFAVRHENALFLMLDVFRTDYDSRVNQAWIDSVLSTNRQPHVFAMSHLPAFKLVHWDCLDDYPAERDAFWNSLSNAHVRLYFCGHDHFYDRARIDDGDGDPQNDIHQVIVATAGAPLYGDSFYNGENGRWTPVREFHEENWGYVLVEVADTAVIATWFHRVAEDSYAPGGDALTYRVGPRQGLSWTRTATGLRLNWTGDWQLQVSSRPSGPFIDVPNATSPLDVESSEGGMFFRLAGKPPDAPQKKGPPGCRRA